MIRAVIFDLDGVLIDSEPLHGESWRALMESRGVRITDEDLRGAVGTTDYDFVEKLIREKRLKGPVDDWVHGKRRLYLDMVKTRLRPHNGADEILRELRGRYRLALASSAFRESVEATLGELGWGDVFEHVVVREDVKRQKPHPDLYDLAVKKLGLLPCECVAVEDSLVGVRAASRAGVHVVAVTTTFEPDELAEADRVIASLDELPEAIVKAFS